LNTFWNTRSQQEQHHGFDPWAIPSESLELAGRIQDPVNLVIAEWQRRILFDFRRLHRHRWVAIDPTGVTTESEEASQVLKALACRQWRVRPRGAERAEYVDIEMVQHLVPTPLAEWQQLALEELAPLADGFGRQVSGLGVRETLLDGFADPRNVGRLFADLSAGLPVVDDLRGGRPVACL
jgi:hypothetical protein